MTILPNAFGGLGECLLNVSKLKTGKVTLARLYPIGDGDGLHAITATAKPPIAWEEAGFAKSGYSQAGVL